MADVKFKLVRGYFGYAEGTVAVYNQDRSMILIKGSVMPINKDVFASKVAAGDFQYVDVNVAPTPANPEPVADPADQAPIKPGEADGPQEGNAVEEQPK